MPSEGPIVFFDGVCNLCNASVDFLLRRDGRGRLRFAPLQGETAARLVPRAAALESLGYWDGKRLHRESGAALRMLMALGGPWRAAALLLWIPAPWRDSAYRFIARNRYRWFGKRSACRLPTAAEAERFLP